MAGSSAYNVYKNNNVNYASKDKLLLMLLEGAMKFTKIARQAIENKNIEESHKNLIKAQNIYYELISTLDVEQGGEWAEKLVQVYYFIIEKLKEANMKKDVVIIDEIIPLMEDVKDTWTQAEKLSKEV